jgi:hypothetical protein
LKAQLGQPIEGEYPESLVENYPDIAEILEGRLKPAPTEPAPTERAPTETAPMKHGPTTRVPVVK